MAECSWNDCENEAVTSFSVGAGEETCPTCGNTESQWMKFPLCEEHNGQYEAQGIGNNSILLINATAAEG